MSRTAKVFVSCAAGAGIGTLVALELNTYLWWIGLLAGALVGYLSYEFKKVISAIPVAWQKVSNWRPDREYWKTFVWAFLGVAGVLSHFMVFVILVWLLHRNRAPVQVLAFLGAFIVFGCFVGALALMSDWSDEDHKTKSNIKRTARVMALHLNPLMLWFWHVPRFIIKGILAIPYVLRMVFSFGWHLFRLIHSEIRLLCAVDAAIGAFVGYAFGSVLIGIIAGGLIGILNYEIVSKRWLKLVPANENAS